MNTTHIDLYDGISDWYGMGWVWYGMVRYGLYIVLHTIRRHTRMMVRGMIVCDVFMCLFDV